MSESTYAFRSEEHTLYAWGSEEEAATFLAIMRTARPYEVEPLSKSDIDALRPGTRILKLAISLRTPL